MNATEKAAYCALRLNSFSEASWAVIRRSTGAIALDAEGQLMTRLTKEQANEIAARLSAEAEPDEHAPETPCVGN